MAKISLQDFSRSNIEPGEPKMTKNLLKTHVIVRKILTLFQLRLSITVVKFVK